MIARQRERMRGILAAILLGLLVALDMLFLGLAAWKVRPFDRDLVGLLIAGVLSPVVTLLGTVLGFYFGAKTTTD